MNSFALKYWLMMWATMVAFSPASDALTFVSPPEFTKTFYAPLTGVLRFTTDEAARVSVMVDDGHGSWERRFYSYATEHELPLYGFKAARTNEIRVTIHDRLRNEVTHPEPVVFSTDALPSVFPKLNLLEAQPERMEPGYTLFRLDVDYVEHVFAVIIDHLGEVVWFHYTPSTADIRQLENGNLFMPTLTNFVEMNLLGEVVNTWTPPEGLEIDPHDGVLTDQGTILYLAHATNVVTDYPLSTTNPDGPRTNVNAYYQKLVEISAENSELLNVWDPLETLDPRRQSYLIARIPRGWDIHHSNAIIEDPGDGGLVVSMRHQHAVVKFARETGELRWILGTHDNWKAEWQPYLLTPVGTPFEWSFGQHAPVPLGEGRWLVYDNGNDRELPFDPRMPAVESYTRAVEYQIDEERMEIRQVWAYGGTNAQERIYTPFKGNAAPLPLTGNVLVGFSAVRYVDGQPLESPEPNPTMVRIQEVTHEEVPEVVFDLALSVHDKPESEHNACTIYRALRIPDLYGHPAVPVQDLLVNFENGIARLRFSADPVRSYFIEASANLEHWEQIATPGGDPENPGEFEFEELIPPGATGRYYRVITH